MKRSSGILLHVTSLPSQHSIGDLGTHAYTWVDFLAEARQSYWQILPLGPTGFGNSPYSSFSAYAGNPLLINLEELVKDQLLKAADIEPYENYAYQSRVRFEKAKRYKNLHLLKAFTNFQATSDWKQGFEEFRDSSPWLDNYAKFAANKEKCEPLFIQFEQFIFYKQLTKLKAYANSKGIKIIGDLPMYVAEDSADRFEAPELFDLESGYFAGSPPSPAFPVGQKWGNPLFRWDKHRETGYRWWINRIKATLKQVDVIRLDYFCGYSEFWASNGHTGHWRRGPGHDLFQKTRDALGSLPFIAEDLGELTHDIKELRNRWGILGTKVLHYAFDGNGENPYIPHNFETTNCVVYTGTHDNDTTRGWFDSSPDHIKDNARQYMKCDGHDISWDLMKLAAGSKADLAIIQYQDVLCLGSEARFNTPGTVSGHNWSWCLQPHQINDKVAESLAWLTRTNNRLP
ncbi:MAG TPA: 4-alpha-glucanotransferase [Planctomycetota bacterium]|nr:4-alpha-glucanotransferase [Planctomycetota bacterium]